LELRLVAARPLFAEPDVAARRVLLEPVALPARRALLGPDALLVHVRRGLALLLPALPSSVAAAHKNSAALSPWPATELPSVAKISS
jgi:hypothetical protein